jgi:spore coat protein U-like protein
MKTRMGRLMAGAGMTALVAGMVGYSSATVDAGSISASALAFGSYDPVSANAASPLNQSSTLTVACTKGTSATIALDDGTHFSGTRRLLGATNGDFLSYALYQDNTYSTAWTSASTKTYNAANKNASAQTVYGQVTAGQDVSVDTYSDSVTATISF